MQVSDSISYVGKKEPKKTRKSVYGDGVIWSEFTARGKQVWKIEVTVGRDETGRLRKIRRTAYSKGEAVKVRRELNSLKLRGVLEKNRVRGFTEFCEYWLLDIKSHQIRATTLEDYRFRIKKYLDPYFGQLALTDINPQIIQSWVTTLVQQRLSTNTINGARRILFGVMRQAQRQSIIAVNPVSATDSLKRGATESTQVRPNWTLEECRTALREVRTHPPMDLFLHLAIFLGLRHGEILGLRWRDINLDENRISINHTLRGVSNPTSSGQKVFLVLNPPKTDSSRRNLNIPPMVRLAFLRHQDWQADRRDRAGKLWVDSEMVFTTSIGTPVDQTNNLKKFKSFIFEKGLRYIRVHDLRHSSAVMALEAGASIESISQALGHSGIEITKTVYAPYVQALNDRFVTALDEYLN
jgi:integrase